MGRHDGLWARVANLLLGGWLFISAFAWEHTTSQRADAAVVGFLVFGAALAAVTNARARYLNTVLAAWLFMSTLAFPAAHSWTEWHNALLALLVFLLSLVEPRRAPRITLRSFPDGWTRSAS